MQKVKVDIFIAGAGISSVLAAYTALQSGKKVFMCEETAWLGGQFTSQAVPPDENAWIEEEHSASKSYLDFRRAIRQYYQEKFDLTDARNPGQGWVSRLCADPRVFELFFRQMLMPYVVNGRLQVVQPYKLDYVHMKEDNIHYVLVKHLGKSERILVEADLFLDGTELGELLYLSGTAYRTGADSRASTNEPSAPIEGDPEDMQPITWVLALKKYKGAAPKIEKPQSYDFWRSLKQPYDVHNILSWYGPDSTSHRAKQFCMYKGESSDLFSLWDYRRIYSSELFGYGEDVMLLNWPQNDYFLGNIIESRASSFHLEMAQELSLSLAYWLQNEAPNYTNKGLGYPEVGIDYHALGSTTGLALYPYIRESRRLNAMTQVLEQDLVEGKTFADSIGIGSYHMDLHITTKTRTFSYKKIKPFQIPLGSLVPIKTKNLLALGKNIGTSHLTSSAYRLHPIEWNIGESAGYYASFILDRKLTLKEGLASPHFAEFTQLIKSKGIETDWSKVQITH